LAPEILKSHKSAEGYSKEVDWWSFGAVIYEMLTGAPPFYSSNRKEILKRVMNIPVPIPEYLSESTKNLLTRLLKIDPSERIGAKTDSEEIKSHPFFKNIDFAKLEKRETTPPI
jgi:serum/glucocorticoid-regulated kinase 2